MQLCKLPTPRLLLWSRKKLSMNHLLQLQSKRVCVSFLLLVPSLRAQLNIDTFRGQEVVATEVLVKLKVPILKQHLK